MAVMLTCPKPVAPMPHPPPLQYLQRARARACVCQQAMPQARAKEGPKPVRNMCAVMRAGCPAAARLPRPDRMLKGVPCLHLHRRYLDWHSSRASSMNGSFATSRLSTYGGQQLGSEVDKEDANRETDALHSAFEGGQLPCSYPSGGSPDLVMMAGNRHGLFSSNSKQPSFAGVEDSSEEEEEEGAGHGLMSSLVARAASFSAVRGSGASAGGKGSGSSVLRACRRAASQSNLIPRLQTAVPGSSMQAVPEQATAAEKVWMLSAERPGSLMPSRMRTCPQQQQFDIGGAHSVVDFEGRAGICSTNHKQPHPPPVLKPSQAAGGKAEAYGPWVGGKGAALSINRSSDSASSLVVVTAEQPDSQTRHHPHHHRRLVAQDLAAEGAACAGGAGSHAASAPSRRVPGRSATMASLPYPRPPLQLHATPVADPAPGLGLRCSSFNAGQRPVSRCTYAGTGTAPEAQDGWCKAEAASRPPFRGISSNSGNAAFSGSIRKGPPSCMASLPALGPLIASKDRAVRAVDGKQGLVGFLLPHEAPEGAQHLASAWPPAAAAVAVAGKSPAPLLEVLRPRSSCGAGLALQPTLHQPAHQLRPLTGAGAGHPRRKSASMVCGDDVVYVAEPRPETL